MCRPSEVIHSQGELWHTLAGTAPQLISYVLSFMTLGIFWNGQQAQLNAFTRSDRNLWWDPLGFSLRGVAHALLPPGCWRNLSPTAVS